MFVWADDAGEHQTAPDRGPEQLCHVAGAGAAGGECDTVACTPGRGRSVTRGASAPASTPRHPRPPHRARSHGGPAAERERRPAATPQRAREDQRGEPRSAALPGGDSTAQVCSTQSSCRSRQTPIKNFKSPENQEGIL